MLQVDYFKVKRMGRRTSFFDCGHVRLRAMCEKYRTFPRNARKLSKISLKFFVAAHGKRRFKRRIWRAPFEGAAIVDKQPLQASRGFFHILENFQDFLSHPFDRLRRSGNRTVKTEDFRFISFTPFPRNHGLPRLKARFRGKRFAPWFFHSARCQSRNAPPELPLSALPREGRGRCR